MYLNMLYEYIEAIFHWVSFCDRLDASEEISTWSFVHHKQFKQSKFYIDTTHWHVLNKFLRETRLLIYSFFNHHCFILNQIKSCWFVPVKKKKRCLKFYMRLGCFQKIWMNRKYKSTHSSIIYIAYLSGSWRKAESIIADLRQEARFTWLRSKYEIL